MLTLTLADVRLAALRVVVGARCLLEPLRAGSALVGGIPLLAVYAISDHLEQLLVGQGSAMERRLETLGGSDGETPSPPNR